MPDIVRQRLINRRGPDYPPGNVILEETPHLFTVLHEAVNPTTFTITGTIIGTAPGRSHVIKTLHYFRDPAFYTLLRQFQRKTGGQNKD